MKTNPQFARKAILLFVAALVLFSGPACAITLFKWPGGTGSTPQPPTPSLPTATPLPQAQVTFHAALPAPLAPNETLAELVPRHSRPHLRSPQPRPCPRRR